MKSGFPRGTRYTSVPNTLFGPLLEAIEDLAELKCTLRALWLIQQRQKKGHPPLITSERAAVLDRVLLIRAEGPRRAAHPGGHPARDGVGGGEEELFYFCRSIHFLLPKDRHPRQPPLRKGGHPAQSPLTKGGYRGVRRCFTSSTTREASERRR